MFAFEYQHTSYREYMNDLAVALDVKVQNDKIILPRQFAIGFIGYEVLDNGLEAIYSDYTLTDDFYQKRIKIKEEYYTLRITEVHISSLLQFQVDDEVFRQSQSVMSSVVLTSSLFDTRITLSKGTSIKAITILLSKDWLASQLGIDDAGELLREYIAMKTANISMQPLDMEYRRLMQEIYGLIGTDEEFKTLMVRNRFMQLIEHFFVKLAEQYTSAHKRELLLSREDINRVMEIESLLMQDIFRRAPAISDLAKQVNISGTKLKQDFKTVYGMPINRYFQKARMQTARDILRSRKYSIKEVAKELGYSNQHNFTIAFKKEFGLLPSQLN